MRPLTVRWRITVIAAVIAAIVLAMAAISVVVLVEEQLTDNLDHSLAQRADQIDAGVLSDPSAALANSNREDRFAQVLDRNGQVLMATGNVSGAGPLATLPAGRQSVSTRSDLPLEDDAYRVLVRRFESADGVHYVVVGENVDDVTDGVRALIATLGIVFPAAALLLAAAVWWLVGRTLRPVEEIRREVAAIGLDELDRRVPAPGTGDEIDRLANTMNETLARLESASAMQRQFVADASHELRTPLTRLRAALEVDLSHPNGDFESTALVALGDAIDMQRLVDDLLFLARGDAGRVSTGSERIDLDVIVDAEVRSARAGTEMAVDMSGVNAAEVAGDAQQLARLVRNLVSNAVRHATQRVVVALQTDETSEHATLVIDDDGPGIDAADRDRIFERFVRLDVARTTEDGGSGLGLAIARSIVTSHGGTITVDDAPDGGARFTVQLPAPHDSSGARA